MIEKVYSIVSFIALLATVGFTDGGSVMGAIISLAVFASSAYAALKESGGR